MLIRTALQPRRPSERIWARMVLRIKRGPAIGILVGLRFFSQNGPYDTSGDNRKGLCELNLYKIVVCVTQTLH